MLQWQAVAMATALLVLQCATPTYGQLNLDILTNSPTTTSPTRSPTDAPSSSPTTESPTTMAPTTRAPTESPTFSPTTSTPTVSPTTRTPTLVGYTWTPTVSPTTVAPTAPTVSPTTGAPTTVAPTTIAPTSRAFWTDPDGVTAACAWNMSKVNDGNAGWDVWQIADPRTIVQPEHASVDVAMAMLYPTEPVLSLYLPYGGINGTEVVRAYPLRFMRWHEVVNDQLPDGSNVTVVYDTRTATALALDNSVLQCYNCTYQGFGNSGFFYESHLLIYDFNSSSLWLPVKGCALRGQQAFWQQELPRFGYELGAMTEMSLELFALLHGNGTVMMDTGPDMQRGLDHYRNYEMNPVGQYRNNSNIMFDSSYDPAEHPYDDWLPDDVKMLGLVLELPSEEYRDVTLRYFVPYPYLRQRGGVLNLRYYHFIGIPPGVPAHSSRSSQPVVVVSALDLMGNLTNYTTAFSAKLRFFGYECTGTFAPLDEESLNTLAANNVTPGHGVMQEIATRSIFDMEGRCIYGQLAGYQLSPPPPPYMPPLPYMPPYLLP